MSKIYIPDGYASALDLKETQIAIKKVKDFFQAQLTAELNLHRVTAPLFVEPSSGLNDNLNGVERPVAFGVKEQGDKEVEVVHSLAKWKRMALGRYHFNVGEGLYTDMNAIRRDEDTDNIHSIYVDQWDWECIINKADRTEETLKKYVKSVYAALRVTEKYIANSYDYVQCILPEEIHFITSQELEDRWPGLDAHQREYEAAKEYGAIFLMKIGDLLKSGERHDGRAPDYDDWQLNGDIIVYYPVDDISLELSSMGIQRFDAELPRTDRNDLGDRGGILVRDEGRDEKPAEEEDDESDCLRHQHRCDDAESRALFCAVVLQSAEVLSDVARQCHREAHDRQEHKSLDARICAACRHGNRTEAVDVRLHQHVCKADHGVLYTGRQTVFDDLP